MSSIFAPITAHSEITSSARMQAPQDLELQMNRIEFKLDAVINYFRIPLEPRSILLQACEARTPSGKLVKLKAGQVISKIESVSPELGWANVRINEGLFSVPLAFVDIHSRKTEQYQQLYALENNPVLLDALYQQENMPNEPAFARQYFENGQLLQSYQPTQVPHTSAQPATKQATASFAPSQIAPQIVAPEAPFEQETFSQPEQPYENQVSTENQHMMPPEQPTESHILSPQAEIEEQAFEPQFNEFEQQFLRPEEEDNNQLALSEDAEAAEPLVELSSENPLKAESRRQQKAASSPSREPKRYIFMRTDTVPPSKREVYVEGRHLNWVKPGSTNASHLRLSEIVDVRIINEEIIIRATKQREMKLKGEAAEMQQLFDELV